MPRVSSLVRPSTWVHYALKTLNRGPLHALDVLSGPPLSQRLACAPVFVLGAPRCGSTLFFQALTTAFDLAYLSNAHCRFCGSPSLVERVARPLDGRAPSDFRSDHGVARGSTAPSECGEWWYRFFPREVRFDHPGNVAGRKINQFRRSLQKLTLASGRSVVFKNLYASLRLPAIREGAPEAVFLVVRRNRFHHAASILRARYKANGNYDDWFSTPAPSMYDRRGRSPAEQVVRQIDEIYGIIDLELTAGAHGRCLDIQYESFCADPRGCMRRVAAFFDTTGVRAESLHALPESFEAREGGQDLPRAMHDELLALCGGKLGHD